MKTIDAFEITELLNTNLISMTMVPIETVILHNYKYYMYFYCGTYLIFFTIYVCTEHRYRPTIFKIPVNAQTNFYVRFFIKRGPME